MTMYGSMIYREYKIAKSSLILRIILGLLSIIAFMVPILAGALTPDESEKEANYMSPADTRRMSPRAGRGTASRFRSRRGSRLPHRIFTAD